MLRIQTDTKQLIKALQVLDRKEAPKAVAKGLNESAKILQDEARRNAKSKLIIRKKYSINGIVNDRKAKGDNIGRMFARTVVKNTYMISQETGGKIEPQPGMPKIAIPGLFSRGGLISKTIKSVFYIDKLKGSNQFFIGTPKGGDRPMGIYYRWAGNRRLSMLRSLVADEIIRKPVNYFQKAVDRYGDHDFVLSRIRRYVEWAIKKTGLGD